MSLLPRALQKIFGSTGGSGEFGQIGSKAAGSPATTKDLELMQDLTEYLQGLNAIVSDQGTSVLPYLEDINSLFFLTTSQLAYLMQSGIPEWNAETEYYQNVSYVVESGVIYKDIYGTPPNLNFQPSTNQDKWEEIISLKAVEFETSKDLVCDFISSNQARSSFSRMSLLDSNYVPKYLNNKSLTWTMPGDLESGQSEEASATYVCWVDSDENLRLVADIESVTDGTTAGFLDDSANTFATRLVKLGDIIYNNRTKLKTTVKTTATIDGNPLEVVDDIFISGDDYKIIKMSPEGLGENRERLFSVYNNSAYDFDDSHYTQIQDPKFYIGASSGADFDIGFTSPATGKTLIHAYGIITQTLDWTGKGNWFMKWGFVVTHAGNATWSWTFSGIKTNATAGYRQSAGYGGCQNLTATGSVVYAVTPGSNNFSCITGAAATNTFVSEGTIDLGAKPTFHH